MMRSTYELTILYTDFQDGGELKYEQWLRNECKRLVIASDNIEHVYRETKPDILVTELGVPQSIALIQNIRQREDNVSIIALTKYSTVEILREVVELGLSSYLIKPVGQEQLREGLRKATQRVNYSGRITLPNHCQWDTKSKTLLHQNRVVRLTAREAKLFDLLVQKHGKFCSDTQILYSVWGDEFDKVVSNASVRTLVKNLRKKLPEGLIANQYGRGYRLTV